MKTTGSEFEWVATLPQGMQVHSVAHLPGGLVLATNQGTFMLEGGELVEISPAHPARINVRTTTCGRV